MGVEVESCQGGAAGLILRVTIDLKLPVQGYRHSKRGVKSDGYS